MAVRWRWAHWIKHDWTLWGEIEHIKMKFVPSEITGMAEIQRRHCVACGKQQVRKVEP